MSKKDSDAKVVVLKGQEAENKILEYLTRMNRPFGAVDVSANLKGQVPKTATQKILLALAEKGHLVQKTYGKTSFFVINQDQVKCLSPEELAELEVNCKAMDEANKERGAEIKSLSTELAKLKALPDNTQLSIQLEETRKAIEATKARLAPLQSGAPLLSGEELALLDKEWAQWRMQWTRRRKVFKDLWNLVADALPSQEAESLAEDLGVEYDTSEHATLESGWLCAPPNNKRKRI